MKLGAASFTTQQMVGTAFAAGLILILVLVLMVGPRLAGSPIVKLFCALAAGAAAAFFTGEAVLDFHGPISAASLLKVHGTAGCGLFILVWLTYGKSRVENEGVSYSLPEPAVTFKFAATTVAQAKTHTIEFEGFTEKELRTKMSPGQGSAKNLETALSHLRTHAAQGVIRKYTVKAKDGHVLMRVN